MIDRHRRRAVLVPSRPAAAEVEQTIGPSLGPAIASNAKHPSLLVQLHGIALYIQLSLQPPLTPFWPCSARPRRADQPPVPVIAWWDCSVACRSTLFASPC